MNEEEMRCESYGHEPRVLIRDRLTNQVVRAICDCGKCTYVLDGMRAASTVVVNLGPPRRRRRLWGRG